MLVGYACPCMLADTVTWEVDQTVQDDNEGPLAHRTQNVQAHKSKAECLCHLLDFADLLEDQNLSSKDYRVADQEACLLVEQRVQLQKLPPAPVLGRLAVTVLRLLRNSPGDSHSGFSASVSSSQVTLNSGFSLCRELSDYIKVCRQKPCCTTVAEPKAIIH